MRYLYIAMTAMLLGSLWTPGWSEDMTGTNALKYQPVPNLRVQPKISQKELRVVPQPGKPESKQPPPDVIGPKLLK